MVNGEDRQWMWGCGTALTDHSCFGGVDGQPILLRVSNKSTVACILQLKVPHSSLLLF